MKKKTSIAHFLFEAGTFARTPRSFLHFLGSGKQTVGEHASRVSCIAYALASLENANREKVLIMSVFHDFSEARISDLNYVHQFYSKPDENRAVADFTESLPFGKEIRDTISEYNEKQTLESLVAHDADQLEFMLFLKEQKDAGNPRAQTWLPSCADRMKTKSGKEFAKEILKTDSQGWWFDENGPAGKVDKRKHHEQK